MTSGTRISRHDGKLSDIEWKRKQGYDMLRRGMKRSVISKKLGVDRKTIYNWSIFNGNVN